MLKKIRNYVAGHESVTLNLCLLAMMGALYLLGPVAPAITVLGVFFIWGVSMGFILRDRIRYDHHEAGLNMYRDHYDRQVQNLFQLEQELNNIADDPQAHFDCDHLRKRLFSAAEECHDRLLAGHCEMDKKIKERAAK